MAETILDRYGRVRLTQIVSSFYTDVLRSPRLSSFFKDVSIAGLIDHQSQFMAMVMGGPPAYTAREIQEAHHRFGITDDDFEEMLRLLENSLRVFEVDPDDIALVMSGYREFQSSVVNQAEGWSEDP